MKRADGVIQIYVVHVVIVLEMDIEYSHFSNERKILLLRRYYNKGSTGFTGHLSIRDSPLFVDPSLVIITIHLVCLIYFSSTVEEFLKKKKAFSPYNYYSYAPAQDTLPQGS